MPRKARKRGWGRETPAYCCGELAFQLVQFWEQALRDKRYHSLMKSADAGFNHEKKREGRRSPTQRPHGAKPRVNRQQPAQVFLVQAAA
jgi:hypothetical protein